MVKGTSENTGSSLSSENILSNVHVYPFESSLRSLVRASFEVDLLFLLLCNRKLANALNFLDLTAVWSRDIMCISSLVLCDRIDNFLRTVEEKLRGLLSGEVCDGRLRSSNWPSFLYDFYFSFPNVLVLCSVM